MEPPMEPVVEPFIASHIDTCVAQRPQSAGLTTSIGRSLSPNRTSPVNHEAARAPHETSHTKQACSLDPSQHLDSTIPTDPSGVETLILAAKPESLDTLSCFCNRACAEAPTCQVVELISNELTVNAMQHGRARVCRVQVTCRPNTVHISFEDDGLAFNPLTHPSQPLGELRVGGYGLTLIKQLAHQLSYERVGHYNRLHMMVMVHLARAPQFQQNQAPIQGPAEAGDCLPTPPSTSAA